MKFKLETSFEERVKESSTIKIKYPDRIPIICEKIKNADLPSIDKKKYLVPTDLSFSQLTYVIRNRMRLPPEKTLFLFIGNTIPASSVTISQIYESEKDEDGFLYVRYSSENTFG
jgi:GABA(A) receptor-associated protein